MSGRKIVYREYVRTVLQQGSSKSPLRVSYASIWGADLQTIFFSLEASKVSSRALSIQAIDKSLAGCGRRRRWVLVPVQIRFD